MADLEITYMEKSNEELRSIINEDREKCRPHECWKTAEGYTARVVYGRRITWNTPCPVTGEVTPGVESYSFLYPEEKVNG